TATQSEALIVTTGAQGCRPVKRWPAPLKEHDCFRSFLRLLHQHLGLIWLLFLFSAFAGRLSRGGDLLSVAYSKESKQKSSCNQEG
ncbi:hypothetical protein, partial [Comamonas sp.]|uniref:hypothetical protein n=1 Tax=Comamonas sp. TaxID=34028 RepID=UPI0028A0E593